MMLETHPIASPREEYHGVHDALVYTACFLAHATYVVIHLAESTHYEAFKLSTQLVVE